MPAGDAIETPRSWIVLRTCARLQARWLRRVGHRFSGRGHREGDDIALGVLDERDALAPRHVGRFAQEFRACSLQLEERRVDVVDVDEELMSGAGARLHPGQHSGRVLSLDPPRESELIL